MANLFDLLNHINFTEEDLEEIDGALDRVIETINSKAEENKIPKSLGFFKFGSIARKTKINPLNDVDVIYILGEAEKQGDSNNHIITKCSFPFDDNWKKPENNISSLYILNSIKKYIKETYSTSDITKNQEVVNVFLSSYEVGFDLVPAFNITNTNYYLIPSGGGEHNWKKTNPQYGEELFNKVNIKNSGQVRNAIKIIKYWFMKKQIRSPKAYHLECGLCDSFDKSNYNHSILKDALSFCFANINWKNHLKSCQDPSGLGSDLTSDLSDEDIKKIVEKADEAKEILNRDIEEFVNYIDEDI